MTMSKEGLDKNDEEKRVRKELYSYWLELVLQPERKHSRLSIEEIRDWTRRESFGFPSGRMVPPESLPPKLSAGIYEGLVLPASRRQRYLGQLYLTSLASPEPPSHHAVPN